MIKDAVVEFGSCDRKFLYCMSKNNKTIDEDYRFCVKVKKDDFVSLFRTCAIPNLFVKNLKNREDIYDYKYSDLSLYWGDVEYKENYNYHIVNINGKRGVLINIDNFELNCPYFVKDFKFKYQSEFRFVIDFDKSLDKTINSIDFCLASELGDLSAFGMWHQIK